MSLISLLFSMVLLYALPQSFVLLGNIRDVNGQVVGNVRVSLTDENEQHVRTCFSDNGGHFEFKGLRSGRFVVRVEPTGLPYEPRSEQLDLQSLSIRGTTIEPIHLDIILRPRKREEPKATSESVFWQEVPEAAREEYKKGLRDLQKNKPESGIASLKRGLELFPDYYDALELLGTEYVKRRQFDSALPVLTHALEVNENSARSLYALGVAHLNLNHPRDAISWLLKAAALDSSNANVQMMLGLAYGNSNSLDKAEASLQRAYGLGGALAADAHLYLAGIYNKQGKYATAVRELQIYLKEAKNVKDIAQVQKMIDGLKAKDKAKN